MSDKLPEVSDELRDVIADIARAQLSATVGGFDAERESRALIAELRAALRMIGEIASNGRKFVGDGYSVIADLAHTAQAKADKAAHE